MMDGMEGQAHEPTGQPSASQPRYVVAALHDADGGYVVYDRWEARVADGRYLRETDAQWAADQRNRQQWHMPTGGGGGV